MTVDATDRVDELRQTLAAVGAAWAGAVRELAPLAEELARLESQLRAAEHIAGRLSRRPPARELAVETLHGHLGALRPYLPHTTRASAERAGECLCDPRWPRPPDLPHSGLGTTRNAEREETS